MYIFIDESGTHQHIGHASMALVYLVCEDLEVTRLKIITTEKRLGIKNFHWVRDRWPIREEFLKSLLNLPFTFKISLAKQPVNTKQ